MLPPMTAQIIQHFFAWAPLTVFAIILLAVYIATRRQAPAPAATPRTYACARCGRRGRRDQMIPLSREGSVVWYCARCAAMQ